MSLARLAFALALLASVPGRALEPPPLPAAPAPEPPPLPAAPPSAKPARRAGPPAAPRPCSFLRAQTKPILDIAGTKDRSPLTLFPLGFSKRGRFAWLESSQ